MIIITKTRATPSITFFHDSLSVSDREIFDLCMKTTQIEITDSTSDDGLIYTQKFKCNQNDFSQLVHALDIALPELAATRQLHNQTAGILITISETP